MAEADRSLVCNFLHPINLQNTPLSNALGCETKRERSRYFRLDVAYFGFVIMAIWHGNCPPHRTEKVCRV